MTDQLRASSIGLREVAFQSIAMMAPSGAIAFTLAIAVPYAGAALPLAVALALVICATVAINIGALAKHMPSAGGYFTYASRVFGPHVGWLVGWMFGLAYVTSFAATLLTSGLLFNSVLLSIGAHGWLVYAAAFAIVTFVLTTVGVELSTRTSIVLGTIEIAVFAAIAIATIASAKGSLAPFDPASSPSGWSGVMYGTLFVFGAFAGFESAATFGEESRDPRRIVPRAILIAVLAIGALFLLCSYAAMIAWPDPRTYGVDASPWVTMANQASKLLGWAATFALINSVFGGLIATANSGARMLFAMGRIGVAPRSLGRTTRFATPRAIAPLIVLGLVVAAIAGERAGPAEGLALTGAIGIPLLLVVYAITCIAVPWFYWRERRAEFRVVRHVVNAVVPVAFIAVVIYLQFAAAPGALRIAGPIDATWLAAGIAIVIALAKRRPDALARAGDLFSASRDS